MNIKIFFIKVMILASSIAIMTSSLRNDDMKYPGNLCYMFPQFISTAASSEKNSNTENITYSFGVIELFDKIRTAYRK